MSSIKVGVRTRPLGYNELKDACQSCVGFPGGEEIIIGGSKQYTFDYVFSDQATQQEIYDCAVKPNIENLFNGYNVTVLAYGQTGSGKTYTMGTNCTELFITPNTGIITRTIYDIYKSIEEIRTKAEVSVKVSFIEVYNEEIFDLLSNSKEIRVIREENQDVKIPGLLEESVDKLEDILKCLGKGSNNRAIGSTAMNETSSRSHAIFTIYISVASNSTNAESITSKLHLVDLAGSERVSKTMATGDRFKEGVNINRGLLALGNVISSLVERDRLKDRTRHIPYRESKLTRLLQDSLGGNTKTLMLACISPADSNFEETATTLNYAARARMIQNKPVINKINSSQSEIYQLQAQVIALKSQLKGSESGSAPILPPSSSSLLQSNMIAELNTKLLFMQRDRLQIIQEFEEETTKKDDLLKKLWQKVGQENGDDDEVYIELQNVVMDISSKNEQEDMETEDEKCSSHTDEAEATTKRHDYLRILREELETKEKALEHSEEDLKILQNYEEKNRELEQRIKTLEEERLSKGQHQPFNELEGQLKEARRQLTDLQKYKREKDGKTAEVFQLKQKIQDLKASIVKATRDMLKEKVAFRKLTADKDKQFKSLVNKDRLLQAQMDRQVAQHAKETAVLKRKIESGAASEKRLKELLDKRKNYSMQRITRDDMNKNINSQVTLWIRQSLDQAAELGEARQRVSGLIEKRRQLSEQLELTDAAGDEGGRAEIEAEIASINECLQQANQSSVEPNYDEQVAANWNQLRNINECRVAIRFMFKQLVEERVSNVIRDGDLTDVKAQNAALEALNRTLSNEVVCARALLEAQTQRRTRSSKKRANTFVIDNNVQAGPQNKKKCVDADDNSDTQSRTSRSSIFSDSNGSRKSMRIHLYCRCKNGCKPNRCGCMKSDQKCSDKCSCKGDCCIDFTSLADSKENLMDATFINQSNKENDPEQIIFSDDDDEDDHNVTVCNRTFVNIE